MSRRHETLLHQRVGGARRGSATGALKPQLGKHKLEDTLQKEYITNLQQQIYFLELEMRLLKEGGASSSASGTRVPNLQHSSVSHRPGMPLRGYQQQINHQVPSYRGGVGGSAGLQQDGEFEDHMHEARMKYQALEEHFNNELETLQTAHEVSLLDLQKATNALAFERERVQALQDQIKKQVGESDIDKARAIRASLEIRKKLERAEAALGARDTEFAHVKATACNDRVEASLALQALRDQLAQSLTNEKRATETAAATLRTSLANETQLVELQERFREKYGAPEAEGGAQSHLIEIEELKISIQKLEIERGAFDAANERRQHQMHEYLKEIAELKVLLAASKEKHKKADALMKATEQSEVKWSDELVALRNSVRELEECRTFNADAIEAKETDINRLRRELTKATEKGSDLHNDNVNLNADVRGLHDEITVIEEQLLTLETNNRVLQEKVESSDKMICEMGAQIEGAVHERSTAVLQYQNLQKRFELSSSIERFKDTDFKGLIDTNMQMVKSLQEVCEKIDLTDNDK